MKQSSCFFPTYSADEFGVCSALFELGGLIVMHDASGCNSTYTTHDEPRWFDMDSMVYISALTEMEAIMGDDEKIVRDIAETAEALCPKFVAVVGTPIPTMIGFDFTAAEKLLEARLGIPAFGFASTGMNSYVHGASMAFSALARKMLKPSAGGKMQKSVNVLGLTPLDFSINGTDQSIVSFLQDAGFYTVSKWAMGSSLEEIVASAAASVNLVVSSTGLKAAEIMRERFGTPYVLGLPYGSKQKERLAAALETAEKSGENQKCFSDNGSDPKIAVVGESVTSVALASALEDASGLSVKVLCPTELMPEVLRPKDRWTPYEDDMIRELAEVQLLIADPLFRPLCPKTARFVPLPHTACSGRMYSEEIPDLVARFDSLLMKMEQTERNGKYGNE